MISLIVLAIASQIVIHAQPAPGENVLEILVRRDGDWRVVDSVAPVFSESTARIVGLLPVEARVALRLRDAKRPSFYWWAEVDGTRALEEIRMSRYKSLAVNARNAKTTLAIITSSDDEPRIVSTTSAETVVPLVRIEPAIVCEIRGADAACERVDANAVHTRLANVEGTAARLLRLPADAVIEAKREGVSFVRPKPVRVNAIALDRWRLVSLHDHAWIDVVLDVASPAAAIHRLTGDDLPLLPEFVNVAAGANRGFAIRVIAQRDQKPIADPESILAILPLTAGVAGRIPLARTSPDERGEFAFPQVAAGTYRVRFVSPAFGGANAVLACAAGSVQTLEVKTGITVSGRLIVRTGGSVPRNGSVQAVREQWPGRDTDLDSADLIRAVAAGDDGRFEFPIAAPGTYRLRAAWGAGRAELSFKVADADVKLGDIALQEGSALRGMFPQCRSGELHLVPLPDPARKTAVPFYEFMRVPIDADGRYFADALREGQWLAKAKCGNASVPVEPQLLTLPATGIVVQDFAIRE